MDLQEGPRGCRTQTGDLGTPGPTQRVGSHSCHSDRMPGRAGPFSQMPNRSFPHEDLILLQTSKLLLSFFRGAF